MSKYYRVAFLLLLTSALLIPVWSFLTEPYIVRPSPLKLFETIHPTYYVGLAALALSLVILAAKTRSTFHSTLNPYLVTALFLTLYIQLPATLLFEHPINDHTYQLTPVFYILREGNINMTNYPHPETVTPQLFASIFIMTTSISSPLENLNRISVFLLPLLTTLSIYIFMRRFGVSERFTMMFSVLNMGLIYFPFMFLRQTYTMPLYIMLGLLIFIALKERNPSFSVLAIITSVAFVMSDPAHVILTIIPLALFTVAWFAIRSTSLTSKGEEKHFRSPCIFVSLLSIMFLFWIISSSPRMIIDLWSIATRMWDIFIKSITELTYPILESPIYWGVPTALVFNDYYASLYRVSISLKALSIALPTTLLAYLLLNKKTRSMILRPETLFLVSYFFITGIVIITRGYGVTYTPWATMITLYALNRLNDAKQFTFKVHRAFTLSSLCLLLALIIAAIIVAPHIIYSGGRIRLPTADIHAIFWASSHSSQVFMISPSVGSWLSDVVYSEGGYHITIGDYLFYEGLTYESIDKLAQYKMVIIPRSVLMHFEKTEACYIAPEMLKLLADKLSNDHNLVYNSGYPFITIWLK